MAFYLGLLFVTFTSAFACYLLARWAPDLELMAMPGEHRQHKRPTPVVGGLALYFAILVGFISLDQSFGLLLPSLFLMCAVGALDDRYSLPTWARFLSQAVAAYIMIELTGVRLATLGFLVSPTSELVLGAWSIPFSIFATVGVINAINMSDGIDGLAASLVMLVLLALLLMGNNLPKMLLIGVAAIIGFLFFNLRFGRDQGAVFLGDAGSMMLGILVAFLLIQHSQYPTGFWPVTALWMLALPLIDAVAVLIARPLVGRSPFSADHSHYHHQLLKSGLKTNAVLLILLLVQASFMLFGWFLFSVRLAQHIQLLLFLAIFFVYLIYLWRWLLKQSKTLV